MTVRNRTTEILPNPANRKRFRPAITSMNRAVGVRVTPDGSCDGTAYCWGYNWYGQLGDGARGVNGSDSSHDRLVPVAVSGGRTFTALVAGSHHTCGLATGGTAYCWGYNAYGQLGDGTTGDGGNSADRSAPVAVSGGLTFASLVAGGNVTCGLVSGGTAYCWGYNQFGQLGDGTSTNRTVPVAVIRRA